ncbi:hypothetical protein CKO27_00255 [Thiocystis violacea]|nr:hypothetical protein [Thiocystis violacea]
MTLSVLLNLTDRLVRLLREIRLVADADDLRQKLMVIVVVADRLLKKDAGLPCFTSNSLRTLTS